MPPQLKTLIPLFAIFIVLFLVGRHLVVPESFGEAGHYRFNSIVENAEKPLQYADKDACNECHEDYVMEMESDMHAGLSCETCHGPGFAHYEEPDSSRLLVPDQREFCGLCHQRNFNREKKLAQIDLKEHYPEKKCIECHNPHLPWDITE
ncbi:MAG TPA: hypothetical protein P5514_06945 [Bacteroidales bacterium]|nr:hypothetical protein [Bacteroidales bacterium]HPE58118.1 hypothetical protein [Bacteroidales bacterium]HRX96664.1 hypothetical protein [Bacteroidales bacterium]